MERSKRSYVRENVKRALDLITDFFNQEKIEYTMKPSLDEALDSTCKNIRVTLKLITNDKIVIENNSIDLIGMFIGITDISKLEKKLPTIKLLFEENFLKKLEQGDWSNREIKSLKVFDKFYQIKLMHDRGLLLSEEIFMEENFFDVYNLSDLRKAKERIGKHFVRIRLCGKIPLVTMRNHKFLPFNIIELDDIFFDWMKGMKEEELSYWYSGKIYDTFTQLRKGTYNHLHEKYAYWYYPTEDFIMNDALNHATSFSLLYLNRKNLLYRKSKRPINNMELFKVDNYIRINRRPTGMLSLDNRNYYWSPVTRYAKGMMRSLFYRKKEKKFCGTFYYVEQESTTYLLYENPLRGRSKSEIFLHLVESENRDEYSREIKIAEKFINEPFYDKIFENKLVMTAREVSNLIDILKFNVWKLDLSKNYKRYWGELGYAREDKLDQAICKLARKRGYDVVIFESVVGSQQIVSEILDTRDRNESFRYLAYLEN